MPPSFPGGPWNTENIQGVVRWLNRTWAMFTEEAPQGRNAEAAKIICRRTHQALKRITRDFEQFEFNTIISSLMELMNEMYKAREAGAAGTTEWNEARDYYLRMMAPVAPHIAEELWYRQGKGEPSGNPAAAQSSSAARPYVSIHTQAWPKVDEAAAREDEIVIPVQVNGKVRERLTVPADASEADIQAAALANETVQKLLEGKAPKKVIVVQKRLVSIVM